MKKTILIPIMFLVFISFAYADSTIGGYFCCDLNNTANADDYFGKNTLPAVGTGHYTTESPASDGVGIGVGGAGDFRKATIAPPGPAFYVSVWGNISVTDGSFIGMGTSGAGYADFVIGEGGPDLDHNLNIQGGSETWAPAIIDISALMGVRHHILYAYYANLTEEIYLNGKFNNTNTRGTARTLGTDHLEIMDNGAGDEMTGWGDSFVIWNTSFDNDGCAIGEVCTGDLTTIYNSGVPLTCPETFAPVDTTPPVISNYTAPGGTNTSDTTPTVTLQTDEASTCNISITNVSDWFGFTTTGGTSHQGTPVNPLSIGYPQNVSVNCTDLSQNSAYATLQFNITDPYTPNVDLSEPLDGLNFVEDVNNSFTLNFTATDNYFTTLACNLSINNVFNQSNSSVVSGTLTNWNKLTYGVGTFIWNVSCIDGHLNSNSSQRSFTVEAAVCTMDSVFVYLNGLNQSRKYEYDSSVNITANGTGTYQNETVCNPTICIDLTAPDYDINYTCENSPLNFTYNIDTIRITELSDYNLSTSGDNLTFTIDVRTDLLSGTMNITGTNNPENIIIYNENTTIAVLPGYLNSTNLTHKSFIYSSVKYNSTNITYITASTETIFINMSASGDGFYNITFQIDGFEIDEEHNINYTQHFNDTNDSSSDVDITTADNVEVMGEYDNFEMNTTYWDLTISGSIQQPVGLIHASDSYFALNPSGCNIGGERTNVIINSDDSNFDLRNHSRFDIQSYHNIYTAGEWGTCDVDSYSNYYAYDGTNEVELYSATTQEFHVNISFRKETDTTWKIYKNNIYDSTAYLSLLDTAQNWQLKVKNRAYVAGGDCGVASCAIAESRIYRIQSSGLWINKSATGSEFTGNGSICFDVLANTSVTKNYTAVWIEGSEYKPVGTDIKYTISADNLTTKQLTINNGRSVFTTQGNLLSGCVNLSGTNETSPIVYDLRWIIIPTTITDIEIDAGSDGDIDWNRSGELNSTSSPLNITIDYSEALDYSSDFNDNEHFLFPISISTGSEGLLQVRNINSRQNPNPINLNITLLEDCSTCNIGAEFIGGIFNITSFALNFLGSINYTALAHKPDYSLNDSYQIEVKYSKFNCSFPPEIDYFEPFPVMSQNDKNVTPYGQEINYCNTSVDYYCQQSSIPIYNCTYLGYEEPIANFSVYVNQTQNGIDLWLNDNVTKIGAINITTIEQYVFQLNKTNSTGIYGWNDFWNTSLTAIYNYYPNITIKAYCEDCLH